MTVSTARAPATSVATPAMPRLGAAANALVAAGQGNLATVSNTAESSSACRLCMVMGILAATQAINAQAAFAMLREESQRTKTTLRDVTERVIATASGSSAWTGGAGNAA